VELNPLFDAQALEGKIAVPVLFAGIWLFTYAYCDKHGYEKLKAVLKALLAVLLGLYTIVVCNNLLQQLTFWVGSLLYLARLLIWFTSCVGLPKQRNKGELGFSAD